VRVGGFRCGDCPGIRAGGRRITRPLKTALLAATLYAALVIAQPATGQKSKDDLNGKEKNCAAIATDWFKDNWPNGKVATRKSYLKTDAAASYTTHYHVKRDTCFMLVVVDEVEYNSSGKAHTITKQVIDPVAKRAYATCEETNSVLGTCIIEGRLCKTKDQWDTFIRALYFEDSGAIAEALRQRQ
jgi:hypothetical protein